eukprot:CAMPEP_0169089964 /NCGR_PEP_ID=MMETSP1015-20121227/15571_1 /TAXON_ID=342587 /ORGANISM="Karlodinium micrum, Strain CCMP2283" /LENGTH=108 /DNA_ID=CAMNT_0009150347 /DNA_START=573 /DNA_END=896 /DNA_ORIENTATION=-
MVFGAESASVDVLGNLPSNVAAITWDDSCLSRMLAPSRAVLRNATSHMKRRICTREHLAVLSITNVHRQSLTCRRGSVWPLQSIADQTFDRHCTIKAHCANTTPSAGR